MKICNQILIGLFVVFIGSLSILHLFSEDRAFSESENRPLAQMPELTWKELVSGNFTKDFEAYLSDQFVKKELWTGVKASTEKALGKKENNGIYFGKNEYLFERFDKPGKQLSTNIGYINQFPAVNKYVMIAPTSIGIYPEKLPKFAYTEDEKHWIDFVQQQLDPSVNWIDVYHSLLESKEEPIYFKTDHHWTTHGAYIAYRNAAKPLSFSLSAKDDFTVETVSKNFLGTYDAKANDFTVKADRIDIYKPKFDTSYTVEFDDGTETLSSLYAWNFLQKRDQYAFFLNGNHGKVVIRSSVKNGRKLLVVKDSYAHALVPFLANHFEEIHMIDLRYSREKLNSYMEKESIEDVLFIYNIATFAADPNLIWLNQ